MNKFILKLDASDFNLGFYSLSCHIKDGRYYCLGITSHNGYSSWKRMFNAVCKSLNLDSNIMLFRCSWINNDNPRYNPYN